MKQYIALLAFGIGVISYAQHKPGPGYPPVHQPYKKAKHFGPKHHPHPPHKQFEKHHGKGPRKVVYLPQPMPPHVHAPISQQSGVNINVAIR